MCKKYAIPVVNISTRTFDINGFLNFHHIVIQIVRSLNDLQGKQMLQNKCEKAKYDNPNHK